MEASQVTVIVISARNLQSKKRGSCLASVVFGIGNDLFGTEVIESNEPVWNQEANFDVSKKPHSAIKFKMRDKDTTIGAVHVSVDSLPTVRPGYSWYPLEPYKKVTTVHGELCLECWISKTQPATGKGSMPNSRETSIEDFQNFVTTQVSHVTHLPGKVMDYLHKRSPNLARTHHGNRGPDSQTSTPYSSNQSLRQSAEEDEMANSRGSTSGLKQHASDSNLVVGQKSDSSTPPLVTTAPPTTEVTEPPQDDDSSFAKIPLRECIEKLDKELDDQQAPEVSGVSPNEGRIDGGIKVTLRGTNLGTGPDDIKQVLLAGIDCTETVEYISPVKLVVTTLPSNGKPAEGPVTIETYSGGVGVSTIYFRFVKEPVKPEISHNRTPSLSSPFTSRKKTQEDAELQAELKQVKNELKQVKNHLRELKDENVSLKEENKSLREYIDKLLLVVLENAPGSLAVK